ncbi:tyrosine-type recombinase/integrase [Actinomadura rupiterrae]|uniref:tyrosine-type recombinase/integrase n=1 Tax=Actinomadura rupiterrae TaxID=559627 RepID=UPI0020A43CBA|nr:site-specific integrase [Actinomadura rupiterrae]MCP2336143.1 integrase [Actinomadura rupiterrae]
MARVKDLWHSEVKDPNDPEKTIKKKTARHKDNGGNPKAKRWLAVWIGPDGKEKTRAFRIQPDAEKYARKMEEDIERGEYIDPKAGRELLDAVARKWLRLQAVGANSGRRYESVYRLHIEPTFGRRSIASVKPSEILEWLRGLEKTLGLSTQEMAHMVLMGVFSLAVADKMRKDNPVGSPIVPKPRKEPAERDPWDVPLIWSVVDAHPAPYRAAPIIAAGCGLRQGEAFAVAEEDFDFENGRLYVRRQVIRIGTEIVFKLPKGGKERIVPLADGVAREVKAHIEAYPPVSVSLPWMQENGTLAEDEHAARVLFVWHGKSRRTNGKCLQTSSYNDVVWKPALAEAGVIAKPDRGPRGGTPRYVSRRANGMHNLRHYFSTALLDAGVSLAGVMEFMGHSKKGAPVTLGVYGHVTEETFESARKAISRSLFPLRAVQDRLSGGTVAEQAVR